MPAAELPRLRARLALFYATATIVLGSVPTVVAGLGAWSGGSTQEFGAVTGVRETSNTGEVLTGVALGLIIVALAAVPIGWALAGRAVRPLATAYAAQRRFVADASHELRTPLTVQRTLIQVTLADPDADAETLRALCAELLRIGDQQERLVAALLALAQGQQGVTPTEPVDLAALVAEAVTEREPATADLTVRTAVRPAVVARADPALMASLIGNLLDNAIRHNVAGGRVEVAVHTHDDLVTLTVGNTGPEVPADAIDQILQPFQRLTTPRTQSESNGLGLAIVQAIADSHQAELRVTPNPAGGLTVTVIFASALDRSR
ncbi:HAMP domain-containing sensor histidine kinase [Actinoplanes sp. M2I2]|uniref:sensor histidine kinase n=1 Tax=Actinoplanes sp. M2I2 TaxID=1734444 RepID=UPI002021576C|nr:HAMP domain-containing sensor histidine kinase [Actinoplanes sp. M2I2]